MQSVPVGRVAEEAAPAGPRGAVAAAVAARSRRQRHSRRVRSRGGRRRARLTVTVAVRALLERLQALRRQSRTDVAQSEQQSEGQLLHV